MIFMYYLSLKVFNFKIKVKQICRRLLKLLYLFINFHKIIEFKTKNNLKFACT